MLQEAFLKLWQARERVDSERVASYLFTICRNLVTDSYRQKLRDAELVKSINWYEAEAAQEQVDSRLQLLRQAIEELPERRRLIFQLRQREGLTYRQIAERLGISPNTVEVQLTKARQSLRRKISLLSTFFIFFLILFGSG